MWETPIILLQRVGELYNDTDKCCGSDRLNCFSSGGRSPLLGWRGGLKCHFSIEIHEETAPALFLKVKENRQLSFPMLFQSAEFFHLWHFTHCSVLPLTHQNVPQGGQNVSTLPLLTRTSSPLKTSFILRFPFCKYSWRHRSVYFTSTSSGSYKYKRS